MELSSVITMPTTPNTRVNLYDALTGVFTASGFSISSTMGTKSSPNCAFLQIRSDSTNGAAVIHLSTDSRVTTSAYAGDQLSAGDKFVDFSYVNAIPLPSYYIVSDTANSIVRLMIRSA